MGLSTSGFVYIKLKCSFTWFLIEETKLSFSLEVRLVRLSTVTACNKHCITKMLRLYLMVILISCYCTAFAFAQEPFIDVPAILRSWAAFRRFVLSVAPETDKVTRSDSPSHSYHHMYQKYLERAVRRRIVARQRQSQRSVKPTEAQQATELWTQQLLYQRGDGG